VGAITVLAAGALVLAACGGGKTDTSARRTSSTSAATAASTTTTASGAATTTLPAVPTSSVPSGFKEVAGPNLVIAVPQSFTALDPTSPEFADAVDRIADVNSSLADAVDQVQQVAAAGQLEFLALDPATGTAVSGVRVDGASAPGSLDDVIQGADAQLQALGCSQQSIEKVSVSGDAAVLIRCSLSANAASGAGQDLAILQWTIQHAGGWYVVGLAGPASDPLVAEQIAASIRFR